MLLKCGVREDSWESLGLQGDPTSPFSRRSVLGSLEGLMLKLKLQYFGYLVWRADSFEKTLMLEKIEGRRGRGRQRMRWLDGITHSMEMNLSKLWETVMANPGMLQSTGSQRVRHDRATELDWICKHCFKPGAHTQTGGASPAHWAALPDRWLTPLQKLTQPNRVKQW